MMVKIPLALNATVIAQHAQMHKHAPHVIVKKIELWYLEYVIVATDTMLLIKQYAIAVILYVKHVRIKVFVLHAQLQGL